MSMQVQGSENWSLLGASKGLGFEFSKLVPTVHPQTHLFLASRSINSFDFSKKDLFEFYAEQIQATAPDRIFYFAAGGAYGPFKKYQWKDHVWTMSVTFDFPAFLLHYFLRNPQKLKQMVFIGSSVAESQADPNAAMYCAAKHALRGLLSSVEKESPTFQVKLFSPGYMNTQMLPKGAWPREQGLAVEPSQVALELMRFSCD